MVSQDNRRFLISAAVGLSVLFALVTFTDLPTLVRLPVAIAVTFAVQSAMSALGR